MPTPPVSIQQFLGLSPENAQNNSGTFAVVGQKVVMGAGSQQSTAVQSSQQGLIWCDYVSDVDCFLAWGTNPTATVDTTYYLIALTLVRLPMTAGNKVAVIPKSGSTGNLWIHPVA